MRKRLHRCLLGSLIIAALLFGILYWASRTEVPALPAGVTKEMRRLALAGENVAVTLYYPADREKAPLVIVAHGFTRGKRYMAGWGADLAAQGLIAAIPTQPALSSHELNARVLAELAEKMRQGVIPLRVKCDPKVALMGFSMGGLTTLLAAARTPVDSWVGLDPVDMDGTGAKAAAALTIPCAILRAEPEAWNMDGNASRLVSALPNLKLSLKVRNATHLDAESPTDFIGQLVCGFTDGKRRAVFKLYATAFLKATLMDDAEAKRVIQGADKDDTLTLVELK